MSFEFDPNKNPDRSEDGNNPQDIESLGGEGGLYGSLADPKLELPIDPRVKPMMVQARTKADP
jgi:hypothetical protein